MNVKITLFILLVFLSSQPIFSQNKLYKKNYQESSHDLSNDAEYAPQSVEAPSVKSNKNAAMESPVSPNQQTTKAAPSNLKRESPMSELRGVWVSTVQRVDFPSKATTNPAVLKKEWLTLLQFYKSLNLNAVIVQIRPTGDAIYPSKIVPYTKWLTGKSGKPLDNNFDLLQFMIESAHTEGIEFHAWVNPYRIIIDGDTTDLDARHPFRAHRDWVMPYGREYLLDPGIPGVWKYVTSIVEEVVKKYDVDAIHFDDYFYPYRLAGAELSDSKTFERYGFKFENIDDWRRANVDSLIFNVKRIIKKNKPNVQLGVSPFAVWRNQVNDTEGSDTKAFQSCYDDLYADVRYWMQSKWLDYVAPEIYFHIGHPLVNYETALNWWQDNSFGTKLYISHAMYKVNNQEKYPQWRNPDQIPQQLDLARSKSQVKGLVFFSSKWLIMNELGVTDALRNYFFYEKSVIGN